MADVFTLASELAFIVKAERGYFRSNDADWIKHCAKQFTSINEIVEFVSTLPETCKKRKVIEHRLKNTDPSWIYHFDLALKIFASGRRICCRCHETGSFSPPIPFVK